MANRDILVIDVGGTRIKVLATGRREPLKLRSGPKLRALPKGVGLGSNANAFVGGYRLWKDHA
jgi:hypothetical protein